MSHDDLQKSRARLMRLMHLRVLGWDPDVKIFRTEESSIADAIEQCFNDPLERAVAGGDWRGKRTGHIYDACSPGPSQYFNTPKEVRKFREQLISHTTLKVGIDVVPIDLRNRGLTRTQIAQIEAIVAELPRPAKRKVALIVDAED